MIPNSFAYKKASSAEEAISLLNDNSKILAGGHSLIPAMKLRLNNPETLIDISQIDSLRGITDNEQSITIGAATTHAEIASSELLSTHMPVMGQTALTIGDIQVRNKGTIGGSMAHADPAADWPAALIAANAQVKITGPSGSRIVDIDQFFTGFFETALTDSEIITSISIPKTSANRHSTYTKFKQPASRFAIAGCAAAIDLDGGNVRNVRVALTGVADHAYRVTTVENALIGQPLNADSIAGALANGVTEGHSVLSDHYASEEYRSHLAKVYVGKALGSFI